MHCVKSQIFNSNRKLWNCN